MAVGAVHNWWETEVEWFGKMVVWAALAGEEEREVFLSMAAREGFGSY